MNEEQIRKGLEKHWSWLKDKEASEVGSFVIAHGKREEQNVVWHHGTCDNCKAPNTLICHFGYQTQTQGNDYCLCLKCFEQNARTILFGWMNYNVDKTIDLLEQHKNDSLYQLWNNEKDEKWNDVVSKEQNKDNKKIINAEETPLLSQIVDEEYEITLCSYCHCLTHVLENAEGNCFCGKCGKPKEKEGGMKNDENY